MSFCQLFDQRLSAIIRIRVVIQRVIKSSPEGTRLYYELNYVLIPRLLIGTNIYYKFVLLQG